MKAKKLKNNKNKKKVVNLNTYIVIISIVILIATLFFYFFKIFKNFDESVSITISNYNNFFIPILTVINIIVFVVLSINIDKNNKDNHSNNIKMQLKLHFFNIRTESINELKKAMFELRNKLEDNTQITSQLEYVRRILISNFESSIYFSAKGLQQIINIESKFQKMIDEMLQILQKNSTIPEDKKEKIFFETFTIINALDSFSLVQLNSEGPDSSFVLLQEINDKIMAVNSNEV